MNASLFDTVPSPNPYIQAGNQSLAAETEGVEYPVGDLSANASSTYVRFAKDVPVIQAPGGGGTIQIFDSRNFPISTTIASSIVTIKPGGLRELHWHPTAEEWVYFAQGQARATVFMGSGAARTFDFFAGDTAVFPDNSGIVRGLVWRILRLLTLNNRTLCREYLRDRRPHLDRDLQGSSRCGHLSDAMACSYSGSAGRSSPEYLNRCR